MKRRFILILLASLVFISPSGLLAQSTTDAVEEAESLRLQLLEVQTKEAALEERVQQLDEDLKPENIERSLAGIGSTRPEELRERRRRQLQIEKDSLLTQLRHLAKTRASLEAAIATADADAYHQSAKGTSVATLDQLFLTQFSQLPKWMTLLFLTLLSVLGIGVLVLVVRRFQRSRGERAV
ncbi:MAG: hypothetical protein ND895_16035 [Pyrinomonadaceae bacterium]|nr:hypothetical protein [Pyrinomonadaceae bacterium]